MSAGIHDRVTRITAETLALAYRIDDQVTAMAGSSVVDSPVINSSAIEDSSRQPGPEQLRAALGNFLPKGATAAEQTRAIEAGLRSPAGEAMRDTMARWIVDSIVPVERLVPQPYLAWRPPVRDAMMFVVAHLSPARLAPKLLEQLELPLTTTAEQRLLRLIAKVPGLQKLGQVIARNQHLRPALRNALARLENGIRDVRPEDVGAIIRKELAHDDEKYSVKIAPLSCRRPVSVRSCASPGATRPAESANAVFSKS